MFSLGLQGLAAGYYQDKGLFRSFAALLSAIVSDLYMLPPEYIVARGWEPIASLALFLSTTKNGACFGMSFSSMLVYEGLIEVSKPLGSVGPGDEIVVVTGRSAYDLRVIDFITISQLYQTHASIHGIVRNLLGPLKAESIVYQLEDLLEDGHVALLSLRKNRFRPAYIILAYGMYYDRVMERYVVLVYDPNHGQDVRRIYVNPRAEAVYYMVNNEPYYISSVIGPRELLEYYSIPDILARLPVYSGIVVFIDPVESFIVRHANGTEIDLVEGANFYAGKDYSVVVLPLDRYVVELRGSSYNVGLLMPFSKDVAYIRGDPSRG